MGEKTLRRMVTNYYLDGDVLYKRLFDGTLLRGLNEKKVVHYKKSHAGKQNLVILNACVMCIMGIINPSCKAKTNMQEDLDGPMTRARAKQLQRVLTSQIGMIEAASELKISN